MNLNVFITVAEVVPDLYFGVILAPILFFCGQSSASEFEAAQQDRSGEITRPSRTNPAGREMVWAKNN